LTARLLPEALQFSWRSDDDLVIAVRRGEDSAFEQLFARYRTRIWTYSSRILGDADRAEDVTQEVFISVLRRLRNTERPIAFKPWVYQIAKNACIDELRRARRTQEVSFDLESDGEDGSELLFPTAPGPDVAIESKQRLEDLQGAFRGVSDLHRRMLVLRELEGLSYDEIGTRLGMSRPVVESTLFRARRRLAEEYEELISGRRCERTRAVIDAWEGRKLRRLGVRETRQVSRHLSHCRPCRRHAVLARGAGAVAHPPAAVVPDRAGVAHPESVAAVVKQSAGAIVRRAAGALVLRKSAGDLPARPVERPITLASRRRPAAEDPVVAAPEPDSLAVA
jgi:RNA polymerase sigma factor (sigma-70 family)